MVCPTCQGLVGEESCSGCRRNIRYYRCSKCNGIVPNSKYASGVICISCGEQVFEHPHKGSRLFEKLYVCQSCNAIVENTKYKHDHACSGCKPPKCNECGARTALHIGRQVEICPDCGAEYPRPI